MKCGKCKGTGKNQSDPKSACDLCGGRGHYAISRRKPRKFSESEKTGLGR